MEAVEIEVGIEPVWRFVCNPTNDPVWCRKVKAVDRVAPDRWLIHHKPIPLRPTVVLTVEQVSATAPHRLLLREEDDASVFQVEYRLEATKSGVRFTQISEFWWKRLPVGVQRLLALGVRRNVRRQLNDLMRMLETA
jgi:hypothetical protein